MRRLACGPVVGLIGLTVLLLPHAGCGIVAPSCHDEIAELLNVTRRADPQGVSTFEVTSPKHSNLVMRLMWTDADAILALRATIIDCGEHVGCQTSTVTPPFGPGGSSPTPQPWPPGLREMEVDGTRGKRWRIEVAGDGERESSFTLTVRYKITCES